jgi:hypothetical protein
VAGAERTCTIDSKGTSSVLAVAYIGRHFRELMRCVFLLVNDTLSFLFSSPNSFKPAVVHAMEVRGKAQRSSRAAAVVVVADVLLIADCLGGRLDDNGRQSPCSLRVQCQLASSLRFQSSSHIC